MATVTLTWTPPSGTNSLSQDVNYRISGGSTWTTFSNEAPTVGTKIVTGLADNTSYDFEIVNHCAVGGLIPSAQTTLIKITCPTVGFINTYDQINLHFTHLGGTIDQYIINLLSASDVLLASQTISVMTSTITASFSGLAFSTTYKIQVIPSSGGLSSTCASVTTATDAPPACPAPTAVSGTIS